jgi:hypothetical protein
MLIFMMRMSYPPAERNGSLRFGRSMSVSTDALWLAIGHGESQLRTGTDTVQSASAPLALGRLRQHLHEWAF